MRVPRVSVVMASYRHAPYVAASVRSVLEQSFGDFELVITDDGSGDGTVEAIRSIRDPRIRLEALRENRGACVALNRGLRRSQGEYVAILNSDDMFVPGRLESQVALLDAHADLGAVFGWPEFIDERGSPFEDASHKDHTVFRIANRDRHAWLRHFFDVGNCLCHPTLMIRRHCYNVVGTYDARLAQVPDFDQWIRLVARFDIHVMPEPMVRFRIRDNAMNASAARPDVVRRDAWERSQVLRRYLDMPRATLERAFPELADHPMPTTQWLAERALEIGTPFHVAFALQAMFDALPPDGEGPQYARFIEQTGRSDPFGLRLEQSP